MTCSTRKRWRCKQSRSPSLRPIRTGLSFQLRASRAWNPSWRITMGTRRARNKKLDRLLLSPVLEQGIGALLHLLRRYVFLVCRDRPVMPERVDEFPVAVAPEHVGDGHRDFGAGFDGAVESGIDVGGVDVDGDGRAVECARRARAAGAHVGEFVGEHEPGIAEAQLAVKDL